ncbi:hypothetical protein ONZ43_g3791 [Nemania bipapillata]|uniref:Uncharacterized protein n=1 Tax=Nemania bipapillata TaxID=110536 RepID=A0ACC2IVM2_9PEZI|nr:hypothetical protein ONZ43_g3791 [Nemania bipapillata]
MDHNANSPWRYQSQALFAKLAAQFSPAWLSMVRRPAGASSDSNGSNVWLFPECFDFVISRQLNSGAWESYATPVDGILNTAAALLTLTKHLQSQPGNYDWQVRSQKARVALEALLKKWDIHSTDQVGQEILIISLLDLLRKSGVRIEFPHLSALQAARDAKLAKIPPSTVYQGRSTLYHSLEAFIGHIDFDNVAQWREKNGSLMDSPA